MLIILWYLFIVGKRKDSDKKQINDFLYELSFYAFDITLVYACIVYVIHSIIVYHQRKYGMGKLEELKQLKCYIWGFVERRL